FKYKINRKDRYYSSHNKNITIQLYSPYYMKGKFIPFPFLPFCEFIICFIIFCMSLNCFNNLLTLETDVPDPFAIRLLRLAFIKVGSCLSSFVIDWIIASI